MDRDDKYFFSEEARRVRNSFFSFYNKVKYGLNRYHKIVYCRSNYLFIDKSAKVLLDGKLYLSRNQRGSRDSRSILIMQKNTQLITNGDFSIGYGADIRLFDNASMILGRNSYVNNNVLIRCADRIEIGDNCAISYHVTIFDSDFHEIQYNDSIDSKDEKHGAVIIGNNVWIGANVTILKGVKIGDNVVIGAGSVVTKDIPSNSLACGNPAKVKNNIVSWK